MDMAVTGMFERVSSLLLSSSGPGPGKSKTFTYCNPCHSSWQWHNWHIPCDEFENEHRK